MKEKISKLTSRVMIVEDTTGFKIDHNEVEDDEPLRSSVRKYLSLNTD